MGVSLDALWTGPHGTHMSGYMPDVGPSPMFISGTDQAVLVGNGYTRPGSGGSDSLYISPFASSGNLQDITFDILCLSDLAQDTMVVACYSVADGTCIEAGIRWGSKAQWALRISGPNLPFGGIALVDFSPAVGHVYRCRLRVRPEDCMFWVDGVPIMTGEGTDGLGTIAKPQAGFVVSGGSGVSDTTGYQLGRLHVVTANPRPTTRNITTALADALQNEGLTLCTCVNLTRADGMVLGFTTHDRDVVIDGVTYGALSAVQLSNIRQEVGGQPDNVEVAGALSSDRITETDLRAGMYDNAQVTLFICDWTNPSIGVLTAVRGNIGDVTIGTGIYNASMRSLMQRFLQQVVELTAPACRVFQLGDLRCKFNLSGNTATGKAATSVGATVTAVDDDVTVHLSGMVTDNGFYSQGLLIATSGLNNGVSREVKLHSNSDTLDQAIVVGPGLPTSALTYFNSTNFTPSHTFAMPIPTGTWQQATLQVQSHWSLHSALQPGTDQLAVQVPNGQANDAIIRATSGEGWYTDTVGLGDMPLNAINGAAGGTLNIAVRHTSSSQNSSGAFAMNVNNIQLILLGSAAGVSDRLVMHEPFPFPVSPGDTFTAIVGCDRMPSTCTIKFDNIINIRCEPFVPGVDKIIQTGR